MSAGVRALVGEGLRLETVISSREVITSFMAFVTGDGVKFIPCLGAGERETGVCKLLLYPSSLYGAGEGPLLMCCGEGEGALAACVRKTRCGGGGGGGGDASPISSSNGAGEGPRDVGR